MNSPLGWSIPWLFALVFGGLGLILMFTACFNYISLSLARSLKRAKEIGIRKVFGAHRSQIIKQFLIEAVLVSLFSLGLAYVFLLWLVPQFNSMSGIGNTQFAIRVEMGPGIFAGGIALMFTLALGIICSQTVKIAQTNPANTLRHQ